MTEVRTTTGDDRPDVLHLVAAAFGGDEEVELVRDIWASDAYLPDLDMVATGDDGVIIGHVLHSRADLSGRPVVALAPLAVAPPHQRRGVGGALMGEAITRADAQGWPLIGLLGHWTYYPRFGFEPAMPIGIEPRDPNALRDPRAFMVRRLSTYDPSCRGRFLYAWETGG